MGLAGVAEHRVDAGFGLERSSGPFVGVGGSLRIGTRWDLAAHLLGGSLQARTAGALDRDFGEIGVAAGARVAPWLTARATIVRRVHATTLARQRWVIVSVGGEGRTPIAGGGVHGILRAALLPVVSVNGLEAPSLAFGAGAGMEYARGAATLSLLYTLERYDFPAQASGQRLEQMSALEIRAALRLFRR